MALKKEKRKFYKKIVKMLKTQKRWLSNVKIFI
jgi:hypothetical protein